MTSILASEPKGHTQRWAAPEVLKGADEITREADVFSFGMVVIEVGPRVGSGSFARRLIPALGFYRELPV